MASNVLPRFVITVSLLLCLVGIFRAQPQLFRENKHWGIREGEKLIIPAQYDTLFNFDASGKVCLACRKSAATSANKFIKVFTVSYSCRYLNRANAPLSLKVPGNDTCTLFSFSKHTVQQFTENPSYFVAGVKSKKNLVDRDFNQLTFKGYHDIHFTPEPTLLTVQSNETGMLLTGLINLKEELLIPYQYSEIKFNTLDSLIIACSAGVSAGAEDDIYNYEGKKVGAYRKHVDMVTRNFVIHKLYEPKEYYLLVSLATKEEKSLTADEVKPLSSDELQIRIKNEWYTYNMVTNEKKSNKQP